MGAQLGGAERAVEADRQRPGVADRGPEALDRMAREVAPGKVGDRHRQHDRQIGIDPAGGVDRGLGVQRVEHGLDQDEIDAALDQRLDLLDIDVGDGVEIDLAKAGIVDVGRERQGLVGRPDRARDPALPLVGVGDLADDPRRGDVDLAHQMLGAIIGLADPVGVEGVGGEDVGAGVGEALRDLAHQRRAG